MHLFTAAAHTMAEQRQLCLGGLAALLCLLATGAAAWPDAGDTSGHAKLWRWMEDKGAFQVCGTAPNSIIAARWA